MSKSITAEDLISIRDKALTERAAQADGGYRWEGIPEIELMWHTTIVNLWKENMISEDGQEIVGLNRFFEFDAEKFQPIFKTVTIDHATALRRVSDAMSRGEISYRMEQFLCGLRGPGLKTGQLNFISDKRTLATSWAVVHGHLSTVIMMNTWDLWVDALHDIVCMYIFHVIVAAAVKASPGPISFVCNRFSIRVKDLEIINGSVQLFKSLVQLHSDLEFIEQRETIIKMQSDPIRPDESSDAYAVRCEFEKERREKAAAELREFKSTKRFDEECVRAYFNSEKYEILGDPFVDIFKSVVTPKNSAMLGSPQNPMMQ